MAKHPEWANKNTIIQTYFKLVYFVDKLAQILLYLSIF